MELIALCIPLVGLLWFVLWSRIVWSQRGRRERRPWRYTFGTRRRRTSDTVKPHVLTVGPTGRVKAAQLSARLVVVLGKVKGNIQARGLVRIGETGSVEGAIAASRWVVAVGAHLHGRVNV